ncbi:uncharacterized protein Z518_05335 [Rhinocladiella mackenziei CBS 650.93]|uniref:Uncharacterized protein n=1 Tax=Rhinocladiella mackenziei CBS 650.93 TaxID=1442369 RepID=A0A0D2FQL1_9EURO|nr:uncharacterized protein Z518_05335 [Rhinocladiella mackenziei CBS 650.93]KIX04467.1 hypothetical protein Z518_05335 [Rhinocladiella mackenziei CBS 650.93]
MTAVLVVGGLADYLIGLYEGKADESILDLYANIRREKFQKYVEARSIKNMNRIMNSDPETVLKTDKSLGILQDLEDGSESTKAFLLSEAVDTASNNCHQCGVPHQPSPMYSSTSTAVFLSLLAISHAFIPVDIQPIPADFDTNVWSPLTTLAPITPSPTPSPTADVNILPVLDANIIPDLKRQVTGQGAAAAATEISQISPITTYMVNEYQDGTPVQVPVVYTQTFAPVPDQWPSATAGEIGLGTIQGTIGVVKTKRSLPTQAPLGDGVANSGYMVNEETEKAKPTVPLMDKLRKVAQDIESEITTLLDKVKRPAAEDEEESSVPLAKEVKLPATSEEEDNQMLPLEREEKKPSTHSHEQSKIVANSACIVKAGTLPVLAITIGCMCFSYL